MVVGIAAAVEYLACFCVFLDLLLYFLFWEKGGGGGGGGGGGKHLFGLPPPLDLPLIKEYFVKLAVWLVVTVGIAAAVEFVTAFVLSGICLSIFVLGEMWGVEHLLNCPFPPLIHHLIMEYFLL